ncbi:MAG: 7-carboxy-7-deazaguanine synthase QueE [Nitrospiraceae bacterium]
MRVTEIFHSIQGESTFMGRSCVFVRLTGCALRCTWCDTKYSFYDGMEMDLEQVVAEVASYGCPLVEVTGGEPLHQPDAFVLLSRLCDAGYEVLLETSGAVDIGPVDRRSHIIMDVKCPGSGMIDRMVWSNLDKLSSKDEAKFVLQDRADYEWARDIVAKQELAYRCTVLFSPVFGKLDLQSLAEWILADRLPVRFQVQLHKFIWSPERRGV